MGKLIQMDLSVLKRYLVFVLFYVIFFPLCFQNNAYVGTVIILSVYVFVVGGMSIEERDKIHMLHKSLPVTAGQIVGAKYVESLLIWVYAVAASFGVFYLLRRFIPNVQFVVGNLETAASSLIMLFLFVGISLPLIYKFGYMKGRVFTILLWVVGSMLYPALLIFANAPGTPAKQGIPMILLAAAAIFFAGSWALCIRIYKNKSF